MATHGHKAREETMGELIVTEFVTLDGVAQAPGGPDEDREGGFAHGGWQAPLLDQESANNAVFEQARSMDALLLGRKTYEIFANYWPRAPEEIPFTGLLNGVPKYVASRTLAGPLAWQGSTLVAGDLAESSTAVKERHDEVHVIGSLDLVQSLLRFGLVDRLNLWLNLLLLGSGKRCSARPMTYNASPEATDEQGSRGPSAQGDGQGVGDNRRFWPWRPHARCEKDVPVRTRTTQRSTACAAPRVSRHPRDPGPRGPRQSGLRSEPVDAVVADGVGQDRRVDHDQRRDRSSAMSSTACWSPTSPPRRCSVRSSTSWSVGFSARRFSGSSQSAGAQSVRR
jgi:dihydrofolate reductase